MLEVRVLVMMEKVTVVVPVTAKVMTGFRSLKERGDAI